MKKLIDDAQYANSMALLNELTAKKEEIERQRDEINIRRRGSTSAPVPTDPIDFAMSLEPGVEAVPKVEWDERYQTLTNQAHALHQAIAVQSLKHQQIARNAGYRIFAHKGTKYVSLAVELLATVDKLIELNKRLVAEHLALHEMGSTDHNEVTFPAMGLHEQLPSWRNDLEDQIHILQHTKRAYS